MFEGFRKQLSSTLSGLGQALSGTEQEKIERLRGRIREVDMRLDRKRAIMEKRLEQRFEALYPQAPIDGFSPDHYNDLDPLNFALPGEENWLVTLANRIIDNFPGGQSMLSQLDNTLRAFSESNHYRVVEGGPYAHLLDEKRRILHVYDLDIEVPIFISLGGGSCVEGLSEPFIVLDRLQIDSLTADEQSVVLATKLAHLFFGNLKIFAFHRLMGILDHIPSVASLVQKGLGLIPTFGNTISKGFELARTVNDNLIRKTNLVIGLQTHLRCDRLASLAFDDPERITHVLAKTYHSRNVTQYPSMIDSFLKQGQRVEEMFQSGQVDMNMMAVLGPKHDFPAYRAFKFHDWYKQERAQKLRQGFYVTSSKVAEFTELHSQLNRDIQSSKAQVYELEEELQKLRNRLEEALVEVAQAEHAAHNEKLSEATENPATDADLGDDLDAGLGDDLERE